ncbi:MAG: hypothetical protein JWR89_757 [Tardiphaga sp.]|uniref:hypothetical protein n=1 Tax=Tardiphaga sp. TaxID=1926292 RepID=UPI0026020714|nr:hypothetical protein [Tardiphaga sp.]MDB5500855.1 hypothetical protein [Tardiphaga sp.]
MARMRSCSLMETAQRVECLDNAALAIAPARAPSGGWTVGLTTSPVDYLPVAAASVAARADAVQGAAPPWRLTIRCRGGRTEVTVEGAGIARGDQAISYQINGGPAVRVGAASPPSGSGVALGGDAVRLVQSLPDGGSLAVRLQAPGRVAAEAAFPLDGLDAVRQRLASVCRWPHALARPGE